MGRIKTTLIKRTSRKLFKQHSEKFTKDFDKNKDIFNDILDLKNKKKMRNIIVGYITRLKRMELEKA